MRRTRYLGLVFSGTLVAFQALALVTAPAASAAVTCTNTTLDYSLGTHTLTITTTSGDEVELWVSDATTGTISAATGSGGDCTDTGATTSNTTLIDVHGDASSNTLAIDSNADSYCNWCVGSASGKAVFPDTVKFAFNGGGGGGDTDQIYYGFDNSAENMTAGSTGFDFNNDGDAEVEWIDVEETLDSVRLRDGDDTFTAQGGTGVGTANTSDNTDVYGDNGNDSITAGEDPTGDGQFRGGNDDDTLIGGSQGEELDGNSGSDTLTGNAGDDYVYGDADNDTVIAGSSSADGTDTYYGGSETDVVDYSARTADNWLSNNDSSESGEGGCPSGGGCEDDYISGDFEQIVAGSGNDTLVSGDPSTTLTGGLGDDTYDGNSQGDTTADFSGNTTGVTVDLAGGTATGEGNDTLIDIQNANGGSGDDTFIDDTSADNDYVGNDGNDTFDQGASPSGDADWIEGDAGTDWANYGARTNDVYVDLDAGCCSGEGSEEDDFAAADVENVTTGSGDDDVYGQSPEYVDNVIDLGAGDDYGDGENGNDTLTGGDGNDDTYGSNGNDTLVGGAGDDFAYGGDGNDTFTSNGTGPDGSDWLDGDDGFDTASYGGRTDSVNLTDNGVTDDGAFGEGDYITEMEGLTGGSGADNIVGTYGGDILKGGLGADNLVGLFGIDLLKGQGGDDRESGGSGPDSLWGGPGFDYLNGNRGRDTCHGGEIVKSCLV